MSSPSSQLSSARKRVRASPESPPASEVGPKVVVLPPPEIPSLGPPLQVDPALAKATSLRKAVLDLLPRGAITAPLPNNALGREDYFLTFKSRLLEGINLIDAYLTELRPGRKPTCTKHCPASAHFKALAAKSFVAKSVATDAPSLPPTPAPATGSNSVTVTVANSVVINGPNPGVGRTFVRGVNKL
ncbi:hypothetical protein FRC09_001842, partial [Ceratobasidium sp. 395]